MAKEVDVLRQLPPVLHEIREIIEIANAEKQPLEATWQAVEDSLNNQFIVTSNEYGLKRREDILGINVPASDSIETRRFRLLARFQEQPPYTIKSLRHMLDNLLGAGNYDLTRNVEEKWLRFKVELPVQGQFEVVEFTLERITPQNMILTIELFLTSRGKQYFASVMLFGESTTVYPWSITEIETQGSYRLGSTSQTVETIIVYPEE